MLDFPRCLAALRELSAKQLPKLPPRQLRVFKTPQGCPEKATQPTPLLFARIQEIQKAFYAIILVITYLMNFFFFLKMGLCSLDPPASDSSVPGLKVLPWYSYPFDQTGVGTVLQAAQAKQPVIGENMILHLNQQLLLVQMW